jgi:hypothetical protein
MPETKQISTLPVWLDNIAVYEAERIYEMMPSMFGERAHAIGRLEAGIIELLRNEVAQRTALNCPRPDALSGDEAGAHSGGIA